MAVSMFAVILIPFVFTLLVLLLVKAPKVGAALIGILLAMIPLGLLVLSHQSRPGAMSRGVKLFPLMIVALPFIFVLLILLLVKVPKARAPFIGGITCAVVLGGLFFAWRWVAYDVHREEHQTATVSVQSDHGAVLMTHSQDRPVTPLRLDSGRGAALMTVSPIWSEGLENEYEADIYPSKLAAVRALGRRMRKAIEQVIGDMNTATKIVLFQDENDGSLAEPFKQAITETLPNIPCSVLFGSRNIDANEIGITLRSDHVVGSSQPLGRQVKATVWANARHRDWEATVRQSFIDKPWMEDFSSFANSNPLQQFIVARSWETCTSPVEARDQALQDAAAKLQQRIGKKWIIPGVEEALTVGPREVEDGGLIADLFLQSFDGVSGRFWRHAMLIDASAEKLKRLDARMSQLASGQRMTWARMIASALGVLVVIVVTYFFLNMATKGYYDWSLRIAGLVLAIVGVIFIFLLS